MAVSWGLIYSESVGIALVAIALVLMTRGRWVAAGVAGGLASATSPVALALVVPALFVAVQEMRLHRRLSWALYTAVLCPVGFVGFVLSDGIRYHDLLYYWHLQHDAWGVDIDFGKGLVLLLGHLWQGGYQGPPGWNGWLLSWCSWPGRRCTKRASPGSSPLMLSLPSFCSFSATRASNRAFDLGLPGVDRGGRRIEAAVSQRAGAGLHGSHAHTILGVHDPGKPHGPAVSGPRRETGPTVRRGQKGISPGRDSAGGIWPR